MRMEGLIPTVNIEKLERHARAPKKGSSNTAQPRRDNDPGPMTEEQKNDFREKNIKAFMKKMSQSREVAMEWTHYFPDNTSEVLIERYKQFRDLIKDLDHKARILYMFKLRTETVDDEQAKQFIDQYGDLNTAVKIFADRKEAIDVDLEATKIRDIQDFLSQANPPATEYVAKQFLDAFGSVADALEQYRINPTFFDPKPIKIKINVNQLTDLQKFLQKTQGAASEDVAKKYLAHYADLTEAVEKFIENPDIFKEDVPVKTEKISENIPINTEEISEDFPVDTGNMSEDFLIDDEDMSEDFPIDDENISEDVPINTENISEERLQAFMQATGEIDEAEAKSLLQYFDGRDQAAIEVYNINATGPMFVDFVIQLDDEKERIRSEFAVRTVVSDKKEIDYYLDEFGQNSIDDAVAAYKKNPNAYKEHNKILEVWEEGSITEDMEKTILQFEEQTGESSRETIIAWLRDFQGRAGQAVVVRQLDQDFLTKYGHGSGKSKAERNMAEFMVITKTVDSYLPSYSYAYSAAQANYFLTKFGGGDDVNSAVSNFFNNPEALEDFKKEYEGKRQEEQEEAAIPPEEMTAVATEGNTTKGGDLKGRGEDEIWFSIFRVVKMTNKRGKKPEPNEPSDINNNVLKNGSFYLDTTIRDAERIPYVTDIGGNSGPALFRRLQLLEFPVSFLTALW